MGREDIFVIEDSADTISYTEESDVSTTSLAVDLLKLAPSNLISHSKSSDLSVNNLYIMQILL